MKDFKAFRFISCILAAFVILFTGTASAHTTAQKASAALPLSQNTRPENSMLQFSSGGHILGFKPDRVYFASFDHAIVEEFVGTKGVMPAANSRGFKPETGLKAGVRDWGLGVDGKKGAPALGKVIYKNLWQGITLKYEAKSGGIAESTYALEPEADVKNIKLKYNVPAAIEKDGSLRFRHPSENGYFSQSAPKAWQDIEGKRTHVEAAFADYGDNTIGFRLGEYDRQYPVVIDPTYSWHTFYGSAVGFDYGRGIAVDTVGNVYVTGYSDATWNGPGAVAPLNAHSGSNDIVVLKLNASGAYQWHTFYGSGNIDYGQGIAVDTVGNVYVTGYSSAIWNGPGAVAPLNAYSGADDIVVLKLNTSGAYQWHTFYGSAVNNDYGYGIAVDTVGNVYVTGGISWVTWNGPGAQAPLNAHSGSNDIVVLKLNASGVYQWHTFYGSVAGAVIATGIGIAVDTVGNVYVTGYSWVTWNGPGAVAPLNAHSGVNDIVVLKLNTSGAYQWHTFYGSADIGRGIAVDTVGNVYVTGESAATWNGPGAAAPLNAHSGGSDIVVLKLNTSGAYQWHTFYGTAGNYGYDYGNGIAVDTVGNVYVTGYSWATWNGPGAAAPLNAFSGSWDIVVLKLNASGAYQWHTFYGSFGTDSGYGIAVDTVGNMYVTGSSNATSNWPGAAAPLNAYSGNTDIVVLKLAGISTVTANANGTGAGTVVSDVGGINYTYNTANTGTTTALNDGVGIAITATGTGDSTATWGGACTTAGGVEAGNGTGTATCTFASLTANETVTATFTLAAYTVIFNSNGGSAVASQSVTYNTTAASPAVPTMTGYTFAGWYSDSGLTTAFNFTTAITGDTTLYAKWTANTYTVTFTVTPIAGTGGSISPPTPQTIDNGSTTAFTGTANAEYYFTGVSGCGGTPQTNTDQATTTFSYTTAAITADCAVDAAFALKTYTTPVSVPTMNEWGMLIFMLLAGLGSMYYMRRRV